jgi:hypothetical protein
MVTHTHTHLNHATLPEQHPCDGDVFRVYFTVRQVFLIFVRQIILTIIEIAPLSGGISKVRRPIGDKLRSLSSEPDTNPVTRESVGTS